MQIYEVGERSSDILLIQPVDDHDLELIESEAAAIRQLAGRDFHLTAVRVRDWNRDLTPWEAPPVFGKQAFGGGGEETLGFLQEELLLKEILARVCRQRKFWQTDDFYTMSFCLNDERFYLLYVILAIGHPHRGDSRCYFYKTVVHVQLRV